MGFQLGVDYGTPNTVAVLRRPDGQVRPLMFDGSPLLPSAVFAADNGTLTTGRDALISAAHAPGLPQPVLVDEPVAAASYLSAGGTALPPGGCLVVYDLGAGTFDVSVVGNTSAGLAGDAGVAGSSVPGGARARGGGVRHPAGAARRARSAARARRDAAGRDVVRIHRQRTAVRRRGPRGAVRSAAAGDPAVRSRDVGDIAGGLVAPAAGRPRRAGRLRR